MKKMYSDSQGLFRVRIETSHPLVEAALTHHNADRLITTSLSAIFSVLIQSGPWVNEFFHLQRGFMRLMKLSLTTPRPQIDRKPDQLNWH